MPEYRLYIDESGDHTYKLLDDENRRYLGISGVLCWKPRYDKVIPEAVENLKRKHLRYDPDQPPILTRSDIVKRKHAYGVLREFPRRTAWAHDVVELFKEAPIAQIFTVVIDKQRHLERFPHNPFNPYHYSLEVLLSRVRGLLASRGQQTDIIAESRGKAEDMALKQAFLDFWAHGSAHGFAYLSPEAVQQVFPSPELVTRRKDQNVAGLQLADLLAYGLRQDVLERHGRIMPGRISAFTRRLNETVASRINRYGRVLLD